MKTTASPIILLGSARSGTTMLGETILSMHQDIKYINEADYIWMYGYAFKGNDYLSEKDYAEKKAHVKR